MIIVTGGAGFIGSNLVKGINEKGSDDILVVDDLEQGEKFKNLLALKFNDYEDKNDFLKRMQSGALEKEPVEAIFHQGACSDTMQYDGRFMMRENYEYSKELLHFCLRRNIPFIYASSASVYGNGARGFRETPECEGPLNVYGFSKWLFDRYVNSLINSVSSQIVGLRYFNVYGPQENHKGRMASVAYHFFRQLQKGETMKLFKGIDGYGDGEQKRDFVYVKDVVKVNLFFFENPDKKGVFNCGTGEARTFNSLAKAAISAYGAGTVEYVEFPEVLRGKYQNFTQADKLHLERSGYDGGFTSLEKAVADYYGYLKNHDGYLV